MPKLNLYCEELLRDYEDSLEICEKLGANYKDLYTNELTEDDF